MMKLGKTPLVSMNLFKNRQFTSGALTTMVMSLGQVGLIFVLPVFLQGVHGLDALHTGFALLPMSIALLLAAPFSGAVLTGKFAPKRIIQTGLIIDIFALFVMRYGIQALGSVWSLTPGLLLYGMGIGIGMAQISNLTLSAVAIDEAGEASGVNNTMRQVGSSLGSAILGALLLTVLSTQLSSGISQSTALPIETRESIAAEVSAQSSVIEFGGTIRSKENLTSAEKAEIKSIANDATVHASRTALLVTIGFMSMALIVSTQLPGYKDIERGQSTGSAH